MYDREAPELEALLDESARPLLSRRVRSLLRRLLPLLASQAAERGVTVRRLRISGYEDPEEVFRQLVVRLWVELPPEEAEDFWDDLADAVEAWEATLPADLARLSLAQVTISVRPAKGCHRPLHRKPGRPWRTDPGRTCAPPGHRDRRRRLMVSGRAAAALGEL